MRKVRKYYKWNPPELDPLGNCIFVSVLDFEYVSQDSHFFSQVVSLSVLFQAVSPDGEAIVTGAGDETLRFWNVFSKTRCTKVELIYHRPLYTDSKRNPREYYATI